MPSMEFARSLGVAADAATCWTTLTDVPLLTSWVSIVDDARELAPLERYTAVLMDRLGPFKLRADLDISVSDVREHEHIRVQAAGEDRQVASRISVDASLRLLPSEAGTTIDVQGNYAVVGRVATLGSGMIKQKATKILDEFFANAAKALRGDR